MGWRGASIGVVVVLVAIWISEGCWGLRLDDLYPFGSSEGDRRLAVEDDASSPEISLNTSIAFYDQRFSSVYVNLNGFLSFETEIPSYRSNMIIPFGYKVIAPFFADIDSRLSGNVFYRETFDPSLLGKASQDISRAFPSLRFYPKSLFIATWDQVGYFNRQLHPTNTFQLAIASNGRESFAVFLYPENGIGWIRGQGKEGPVSQDPDAQAGFDAGDGRRHLTLPGSGNPEVRNLPSWNNAGVSGLFLFHIGNTRGQNIQTPSSHPGVFGEGWRSEEEEERGRTCSDGGLSTCHSQAKCLDFSDGFCCECKAPYIGNGIDCLRPDEPLRVSGKVSGTLNGVTFDGFDLHAYVVTSDGRTYTALSRMDEALGQALGQALLSLYSVAGVLGFLFALPQQPAASNGFSVTGYDFNRTAVISYQPGRETVTIRQTITGTDVPGHLKLETTLDGTIPQIPDNARVEADDYKDEYRRIAPGVLRLSSANTFRVNGSPQRFTVQETIAFRECPSRPFAHLVSMTFAVSRNFFVYSENERIVRYSQTNKAYLSGGGEDPCRSANCDARATCIAEESSYTCVCKSGFEGNGQRCQDVDECHQRTSDCHADADCVNTDGSFECRCRDGLTGDGRHCQEDVQAKSCQRLKNCAENAECVYEAAAQRYVCRCNRGYSGDGYSCQSLQQQDDCTLDVNCDVNANCVYDAVTGRHGCRCGAGYEGNGKSCSLIHRDCRRDAGLCTSNAQCSWDGSEYICQCDPGYHGDGYRTCTVASSGSYLLYAQGMYIMQTPFVPSHSNPAKQILSIPGQTAIGIDVDCQGRHFYWTDINSKVINRADLLLLLNTTDYEVIVTGLSSPEAVAVDWISRNLYWTDSGSDSIGVSRLDGTHHKTLFSDGLVNPRGVAVDPIRGFLFWTDWNREAPKIERSTTDGSNRRTIVSDGLSLPNGLTIDFDRQLLCWSDAGTKKVECSSYDGTNRRPVSQSAGRAFGLTYDNDVLYWTDWDKPTALSSADLQHPSTTNADLPLPSAANGKQYGIATVKQHCPSGSNPCASNNGGCRFLCLPSKGGRTCVCPDDIDPEECNRIALV